MPFRSNSCALPPCVCLGQALLTVSCRHPCFAAWWRDILRGRHASDRPCRPTADAEDRHGSAVPVAEVLKIAAEMTCKTSGICSRTGLQHFAKRLDVVDAQAATAAYDLHTTS